MVASDDRKSDDRVGVRTEEADHVPKQDSADPAPLELRVDVQIRDLSGLLHRFMSTGTVMSKPNKSPVALGKFLTLKKRSIYWLSIFGNSFRIKSSVCKSLPNRNECWPKTSKPFFW